jgi:SHS2 domain-containing protein
METREQAQLRAHLKELRLAAHAIGRDVVIDVSGLDEKIDRLGKLTKKQLKYAVFDLEDDLANLRRTLNSDIRSLPGAIRDGAVVAGTKVEEAVSGAAVATREAVVDAGHATKEASKNALAKLAGVNRKPMKEWTGD